MRPDAIPMVGKKYGHVLVLAEAGRKQYATSSQRLVRVQCDCGNKYETFAQHVRRKVNRCAECRDEFNRRHGRDHLSVRLPNGKTIAQIAEASGLELGTVYRRWLRGWPVEKLGTPLRRDRRRLGLGGSVDLPERRRTMYREAP